MQQNFLPVCALFRSGVFELITCFAMFRKITLTKHIKRHHPTALLTPVSDGYPQQSPRQQCSPTPSRGAECSPSPEMFAGEVPMFGLGIHLPMSNGSSLILPPSDNMRCSSAISSYSGFSGSHTTFQSGPAHPFSSPVGFESDPNLLPPSPPLTTYGSEDCGFDSPQTQYPNRSYSPVMQERNLFGSQTSVRDLPPIPEPFFWPNDASQQTLPRPSSPLQASRYSGSPLSPRAPFIEKFEDGPAFSLSSPTYSRFGGGSFLPLMIQSPTFAPYFSLSSPTFFKGCKGNPFSYDVPRRYSVEVNGQMGRHQF